MKLASETALFEALQVGSIHLIELAATSALHTATEEIATLLLADFDAGSYVEEFHVPSMIRAGQCYTAQLALGHGFVSNTPSVVVATTFAGLADGETLADTEYKFDAEKGSITIVSTTDYSDWYARVSYSAGFAADVDDDELFADVPQWLQVAATKLGSAILIEAAPDLAGNESGTGRSADALRASVARVCEKHIRYFPSPARPI